MKDKQQQKRYIKTNNPQAYQVALPIGSQAHSMTSVLVSCLSAHQMENSQGFLTLLQPNN